VAAFETRKDKYSFHKLARKYDEQSLPYFLAVNFYENKKVWVRSFFDVEYDKRFEQWKVNQTNRVQRLDDDLAKIPDFKTSIQCVDNQSPELLLMVYRKEISVDTFVILDRFMKLGYHWSSKLKDDFIFTEFYDNILKYKGFFYTHILFDTTTYSNTIKSRILK
jgi:hypothetical protein